MTPKLLKIAAMTLLLTGCCTPRLPVTAQDNTAAILADPEFPAMARAAPTLTKKVLRKITELETSAANRAP